MKSPFVYLILAVLVSFSMTACGDSDDSDNPAPIASPEQPDSGNNDNDEDAILWAQIRLEKHHDQLDETCTRDNVDILIIRENGQYHLEECHGIKEGQLTSFQLQRIRRYAARWLRSDQRRRICAEASPQSETYLRMTMHTGTEITIYEELTAQGLCSRGDRRAALLLHNMVLRTFHFHDIPAPESEM